MKNHAKVLLFHDIQKYFMKNLVAVPTLVEHLLSELVLMKKVILLIAAIRAFNVFRACQLCQF